MQNSENTVSTPSAPSTLSQKSLADSSIPSSTRPAPNTRRNISRERKPPVVAALLLRRSRVAQPPDEKPRSRTNLRLKGTQALDRLTSVRTRSTRSPITQITLRDLGRPTVLSSNVFVSLSYPSRHISHEPSRVSSNTRESKVSIGVRTRFSFLAFKTIAAMPQIRMQ